RRPHRHEKKPVQPARAAETISTNVAGSGTATTTLTESLALGPVVWMVNRPTSAGNRSSRISELLLSSPGVVVTSNMPVAVLSDRSSLNGKGHVGETQV